MDDPALRPSRDDQVTVAEALRMVRMSRTTLYRHIRDGRIAAVTGAGRIRLHIATVRALAPKPPQ